VNGTAAAMLPTRAMNSRLFIVASLSLFTNFILVPHRP
jgi:hypothetical protein